MPNNLLSTAEAADRLGVSVRTVTRWAESGRLPVAHRMPGVTGAMLFEESAVDSLVGAAS
jgi:excisionase family DNA binding protein